MGRSLRFLIQSPPFRLARLALWRLSGRGRITRPIRPLVHKFEPGPLPQDPYAALRGPVPIQSEAGRLVNPDSGSGIAYTLYRPARLDGLHPVVIYLAPPDWGAGYASPPPARYLMEHFAASGYVAVFIGEMDSNKQVFPTPVRDVADPRAYVARAIRDPDRAHDRFLDTRFAIDAVLGWNGAGPLAGHMDTERVGLCGNSFGARSVFALIGERVGPSERCYRHERIKAAIIYSSGPTSNPDGPRTPYADIRLPVCHMAGSRDFAWDTLNPPEDRLWPYHWIDAPHQYKVMLKHADHLTFPGGRADTGSAGPRERRNLQFVRSISLAFWDAYLRGDTRARQWLDRELAVALRGGGYLERK